MILYFLLNNNRHLYIIYYVHPINKIIIIINSFTFIINNNQDVIKAANARIRFSVDETNIL